MPFSPIVVANFFISEYDPLRSVELQKLVYFAHGWHLGLTGKPLIDEEPEAWEIGPVFPTLYHARKHIGSNKETIPTQDIETDPLPNELHRFLEAIHTRYGSLYGGQMTALTHRRGSPWYQIANPHLSAEEKLPVGLKIPNSLIEEDYKSLAGSLKTNKADEQ